MSNLAVNYMGLKMKNPIIVSSSSMTQTATGVKKCADNGAGAVVLKSLFEEQIVAEIGSADEGEETSPHPEAREYIEQMGMRLGPSAYLDLIRESKSTTDVPIIASINCITAKWWVQFAKQIQSSGADALELNISIMPRENPESSESVEQQLVQVVRAVRSEIDLPLAVKIGPYFSSLPSVATQLVDAGADALVLFNRFYQLDIDIAAMKMTAGNQFSDPQEIHLPLRWISILAGKTRADLAATTGIHDGEGAIKMLLAGATVVQLCSGIFLHGFGLIEEVRSHIEQWMNTNAINSVDQFRGKLSRSESKNPEVYERLQYIKALTGVA